jgi:hypothetical protein
MSGCCEHDTEVLHKDLNIPNTRAATGLPRQNRKSNSNFLTLRPRNFHGYLTKCLHEFHSGLAYVSFLTDCPENCDMISLSIYNTVLLTSEACKAISKK